MTIDKHDTKPIRDSRTSFQELYDEISHDWQAKAARLRARRWDKLNRGHGF